MPHRINDEDNTRHLKLMGDLGMINAVPFHARDPDSIAAAVEKSDVVINLLGKQYKTRNFDFVGANVEAVSNIAKVCKEVGVPKFVHVSALAASEASESEWLRCKAMGEAQVRNYYPDAVILRPNVIFGEEDNFLNLMAKWTKIFGMIPIHGSGDNKLQPVYVDDVAECVRAAVFDSTHAGKTYELSGPGTRLLLLKLFTADVQSRKFGVCYLWGCEHPADRLERCRANHAVQDCTVGAGANLAQGNGDDPLRARPHRLPPDARPVASQDCWRRVQCCLGRMARRHVWADVDDRPARRLCRTQWPGLGAQQEAAADGRFQRGAHAHEEGGARVLAALPTGWPLRRHPQGRPDRSVIWSGIASLLPTTFSPNVRGTSFAFV